MSLFLNILKCKCLWKFVVLRSGVLKKIGALDYCLPNTLISSCILLLISTSDIGNRVKDKSVGLPLSSHGIKVKISAIPKPQVAFAHNKNGVLPS